MKDVNVEEKIAEDFSCICCGYNLRTRRCAAKEALNIVLNNLGTSNSAWTSGNFDGATTIDLTDLNDVLNNLGLSSAQANNPAPSIPAAPEPAAWGWLAAGSANFFLRRRKR